MAAPRLMFGLVPVNAARAARLGVEEAMRREYGDDPEPADAELSERLAAAAQQAVLDEADDAAREQTGETG